MKQLAFYPGCALQSMSWDYRDSIKQTAKALELDLMEIEDWTCCGASAAHSLDERMSIVLPARNLVTAQAMGRDVSVACPMCFKRLSYSKQLLLEQKVDDRWTIDPDLEVNDLARQLTSPEMLERIKESVVEPLNGLRVVSYYGCQVVRHPKVTGYEEYGNPRHMDLLAEALGAVSIDWSFKTVCCGAGLGIPKKQIGLHLVKRLLTQAHASGAQAIVVCCPLCQSNLDLYQQELCRENGWDLESWGIPILYYTELISLALGIGSAWRGLKSHMVNPIPLIGAIISEESRRNAGRTWRWW